MGVVHPFFYQGSELAACGVNSNPAFNCVDLESSAFFFFFFFFNASNYLEKEGIAVLFATTCCYLTPAPITHIYSSGPLKAFESATFISRSILGFSPEVTQTVRPIDNH